ncbi:MAG: complex I NDUFA9 subunit family protein [Rhodocyclaceae bacterium]|nr:complex I NDUFA9 subunit family protein [Rhodocyclaceae bacterium]
MTSSAGSIRTLCVIGGGGFVGHHLCAHLAQAGYRLRVPTRHRERAKQGLLELPAAEVFECDVMTAAGLDAALKGCDAVINLVGILHERRRGDFDRVHGEFPGKVVEACRRHGIHRYLHMSALGAAPDAPSRYLRSRAAGEAAARKAAGTEVAMTVFRPSVIFGAGDSFLTLFAGLAALPVLPLAGAGVAFQPVWVGDVARVVASSVTRTETFGQIYELGGPDVFPLRELVRKAAQAAGRDPLIIGLPGAVAWLQAWVFEHLPGPIMTRDNLASMQVPNVTKGGWPEVFAPGPRPLDAVLPTLFGARDPMDRYRQRAAR